MASGAKAHKPGGMSSSATRDLPAPSGPPPSLEEGLGVAFIDVEASGLGPYSWPIEVGWGFHGYQPTSIGQE